MKWIDTHAHYTSWRFDEVREALLAALPAASVRAVLNAAIEYESNEAMLTLGERYPYCYTAVGVHPNHVQKMTEAEFRQIEAMLGRERVIAVGETGLDYHRGRDFQVVQQYWFHRFLDLAARYDKPLVIHTRMAEEDTLAILREHALPVRPGVIHCFNDSYEAALAYIGMGFKLGVGGAFTKDAIPEGAEYSPRQEVLRRIPREAIVLETDCPYLIPAGCGETELAPWIPAGCGAALNHSLYLPVILRELARLRGEDEEALARVVYENAQELFPEMEAVGCF